MPGPVQQNEIAQLQKEIYAEIQRDSSAMARQIFGDVSSMPDVSSVSDARLQDIYRQKYLANDRQWLQSEARRDPKQFMRITDKLGVSNQPMGTPSPAISPDALGQALTQAAASAQPPPALPSPPAPALPSPPVPVPPVPPVAAMPLPAPASPTAALAGPAPSPPPMV